MPNTLSNARRPSDAKSSLTASTKGSQRWGWREGAPDFVFRQSGAPESDGLHAETHEALNTSQTAIKGFGRDDDCLSDDDFIFDTEKKQ